MPDSAAFHLPVSRREFIRRPLAPAGALAALGRLRALARTADLRARIQHLPDSSLRATQDVLEKT